MKRFLLITLILFSLIFIASCDLFEKEEAANVNFISESNFIESNNKYKVADSFALDDGNYYYFYYLGAVDYVPLNLADCEGVYFNGNDTSLEFKLTTTDIQKTEQILKNSLESSVNLKNSSYVKGSVSSNIMSLFDAKIESGIMNEATNSLKDTFSESFSTSVSQQSSFEEKITYKMSKNDAVGYYFYTPVASVKFYEIVVYNPSEEKIEYMSTYNVVGNSLPGLYYSELSFLDCSVFDIEFDESQLPQFTTPSKTLTSNVTLSVDSNGGECEATTFNATIGDKYGTLPTATKEKYVFDCWTVNGQEITEDSTVVSCMPLVAKWELLTQKSYSINKTFEFSSDYKLNPFYLLIDNMDGEVSGNGMNIVNDFDFEKFKNEGYKMQIRLDYKVKFTDWLLSNNAHFKFNFKSGSKTVTTISDKATGDSFSSRTNFSNYIDLSKVNGSFDFTLTTENIQKITIKNLVITITFVKDSVN